jgi:uncharacterized membrane protein YgcG
MATSTETMAAVMFLIPFVDRLAATICRRVSVFTALSDIPHRVICTPTLYIRSDGGGNDGGGTDGGGGRGGGRGGGEIPGHPPVTTTTVTVPLPIESACVELATYTIGVRE